MGATSSTESEVQTGSHLTKDMEQVNSTVKRDVKAGREGRSREPRAERSASSGNTASTELSNGSEVDDHHEKQTRAESLIKEESVPINLPMADLMEYMQSVAAASTDLPLTRRDDPELGRTVSTLTAEEYAQRSQAFIPADVRIICGLFTKYSKVWDLPNSEEFNIIDGAQEPGRSLGGACCNSLLKVQYDTQNSADEVVQADYANPSFLFKDDSHESDDTPNIAPMQTASFASLDIGSVSAPCSITWEDLLHKMRAEIQLAGHAQMPIVTSSHKFDLNDTFSLVPPAFDPNVNKKRSLFIGINYGNIEGNLKACHDDVRSMQDFVVNIYGFPRDEGLMTVLMDDGDHKMPTYANITEAFTELSKESKAGDAVLVHFSGHGCRVLDSSIDPDVDAYDESIVPSDFRSAGLIRDTLIFKTLIAPMRKGVTVTCIFDACDKGIKMDLPYTWSPAVEKSSSVSQFPPVKQLIVNDDFSFVRCLKVIKTMYDGSKFTQLGRIVRTAIHQKSPKSPNSRKLGIDAGADDLVSFDDGSLITVDREEKQHSKNHRESTSFFANVLSACHSPANIHITADVSDLESTNGAETHKEEHKDAMPSLFQQMLNCNGGLMSDEETPEVVRRVRRENDDDDDEEEEMYESDTYGDDTYGDDTYGDDTYTDDGTATSEEEFTSPERVQRRRP